MTWISQSENWDIEEGQFRQRGQGRQRFSHTIHLGEHPHQAPWDLSEQQLGIWSGSVSTGEARFEASSGPEAPVSYDGREL